MAAAEPVSVSQWLVQFRDQVTHFWLPGSGVTPLLTPRTGHRNSTDARQPKSTAYISRLDH
jgi:hypothetical protein